MYIFKVNEPSAGILTYTFQDTSWGKYGDCNLGIVTFISAFKKQYKGFHEPVTLTIMNDRGEYYHPALNKYKECIDYKDIQINLN